MGNPSVNWKRIPICILVVFVFFALFFHLFYRPWNLRWGATDEEVDRWMVGDDLVRDPTFDATRAITIYATPDHIWPWIVQIGYKKAGFYSYDFLDNDNMPSADRIIPEFQDLKVGDLIPLTREIEVEVIAMKEDEHMLLDFGPAMIGTWSWGIYPVDHRSTRLVSRLRVRLGSIGSRYMWDTFEIIMMRKHLLGIKERAEMLAVQERP